MVIILYTKLYSQIALIIQLNAYRPEEPVAETTPVAKPPSPKKAKIEAAEPTSDVAVGS